ncbi:DUF58 domain-containing protein [Bacillus sp. 2205SS5-2]|uniref:DUF58 domain-containing protein n=1 Tax=Bacillus sp. 2205SS5-2 TaxID=3109031 RepID=UPI003006357F
MIMPSVLLRLSRYRLSTPKTYNGIHQGSRQSLKKGHSLEFSDHKMYQAGDDLRQIDWNIYARTNRHYVKTFLDEQSIHISIYLDSSPSMTVWKEKWEKAKDLAAAFAFISLNNGDSITCIPVGTNEFVPIKRKGITMNNQTVMDICRLPHPKSAFPFSKGFSTQVQKKSHISILISDGLEPLSHYKEVLKRVRLKSRKVLFLQLLSEKEDNPHLGKDVKWIDSETREEMNVTLAKKTVELYGETLQRHCSSLQSISKNLQCFYVRSSVEKSLEEIILGECRKVGWVS